MNNHDITKDPIAQNDRYQEVNSGMAAWSPVDMKRLCHVPRGMLLDKQHTPCTAVRQRFCTVVWARAMAELQLDDPWMRFERSTSRGWRRGSYRGFAIYFPEPYSSGGHRSPFTSVFL